MSEDKDLEVKGEQLPSRSSGKEGKPLGFEEVDIQQDILLPRVAILQSTSQMVTEGVGKLGELADSISKEVFGKEFSFIPLYCFKTRCKFDVGQGLVCQSRSALECTMNTDNMHEIGTNCLDCKDAQWPEDKEAGGPPCNLVYNFPAINVSSIKAFPISVSLMKTSAKAGKKLISLAFRTGEDMFARKYKLITNTTKNDKGTYSIADIELLGRCTDEEYEAAKAWYNLMRVRTVDVDLDGEKPNFDN
uniref:Uncharacterized protein n=1 Tax=viral metagenome TaxID=1070528 RepID=A0A6M3JJ08_9ZZZZ